MRSSRPSIHDLTPPRFCELNTHLRIESRKNLARLEKQWKYVPKKVMSYPVQTTMRSTLNYDVIWGGGCVCESEMTATKRFGAPRRMSDHKSRLTDLGTSFDPIWAVNRTFLFFPRDSCSGLFVFIRWPGRWCGEREILDSELLQLIKKLIFHQICLYFS